MRAEEKALMWVGLCMALVAGIVLSGIGYIILLWIQ